MSTDADPGPHRTGRRKWNALSAVVDLTVPTPFLHDSATSAQAIPLDSPAWEVWLADPTHTRFHVRHHDGDYTARYDQRGGNFYWFGFRYVDRRSRCLYLGRTSQLTAARLREVGAQFEVRSAPK